MGKCIHCGGTNLTENIQVALTAEMGNIGLEYVTKFLVHGVEPFYADLCNDCGSITRLHVKNRDRRWRLGK